MSREFEERLFPILPQIVEHYGTPFHIIDEVGILETGQRLKQAFSEVFGFQEFFAVKACPIPAVLKRMYKMGFGFDCSSIPELIMAREAGAGPGDIMFTSNNTGVEEYLAAASNAGCILNLDDRTFVAKVPGNFPELICFRYNPGDRRIGGNEIFGNPKEQKYGIPHEQIVDAYQLAINRGAKRFGIHTMICSNELNYEYMVGTVKMLLNVVEVVSDEFDIRFEFINMGGGLGIPYKPEDIAIPLERMAREIQEILGRFEKRHGYVPKLYLESGRYMTGPHGALVLTVINRMSKYFELVGVDGACTATMMRPAMYYDAVHNPDGGYHYISVFGKTGPPWESVNVVGSACENNDQFGRNRLLPLIQEGDTLLVHDTGAHAIAMGSNYNSRLLPAVVMLCQDGTVKLVRRAQTIEDYLSFFNFKPDVFTPQH